MDAKKEVENLVSLLGKKKICISEMLEITKAQESNIKEDSIELLNGLLQKKDELIKRVDELDELFNNTYRCLKDELQVDSLEQSELLPPKLLLDLKNCTKEILDIMYEIKEIDDKNNKAAKDLKDSFAAEIKKINASKVANNAYRGGNGFVGAHFIDSKK